MGAFDHMVWAPWKDEEGHYKSVRGRNICVLTLAVVALAAGYGFHFLGFAIEHLMTTGRHAWIFRIHVNDYAAMGVFLSANQHLLALFVLHCIIVPDYYICGRMWFPTVKKIALLKERMKNA